MVKETEAVFLKFEECLQAFLLVLLKTIYIYITDRTEKLDPFLAII